MGRRWKGQVPELDGIQKLAVIIKETQPCFVGSCVILIRALSLCIHPTINSNHLVGDIPRLHHPNHRLSNFFRLPKPSNWDLC